MALVVSYIQRDGLVTNPEKILYAVTNPARGLLNRENRTEERGSLAAPRPRLLVRRRKMLGKLDTSQETSGYVGV